jgi:hypothetical protein
MDGIQMTKENPVVAVFNTHVEADEAVRTLNQSGFDMKKLSIVGKGYHSEEHAVGFYTAGDRIKSWGASGAFWGGIWGLLFAPALFLIPGVGLVALAGPVVAAVVGGLEGAILVGGLSALGAGLMQLGLPKDKVIKYETALKADKFIVIAHGDADEVKQARDILKTIGESDVSEE